MTMLQKVAIVVPAVAIALLAFIAGAVFATIYMVNENLRLAAKHIAVVEPTIRADSRFQKVLLNTYTARHGCITVDGEVASDQAMSDLRRLLGDSPVSVAWRLDISSPESTPK